MPTATAMCTRIRVADGKNTTTAVGTAYRTPDRHSRSTPTSRRASGVISAPLPPLGAREAGAASLAALIVVREAVGTLETVVDLVSVVVGTVEISVVSVVAEEVGVVVALAGGGLAEAGSAGFAAEGSGGSVTSSQLKKLNREKNYEKETVLYNHYRNNDRGICGVRAAATTTARLAAT